MIEKTLLGTRVSKSFTISEHSCENIVAEYFGMSGGFVNDVCDIEIPDGCKIVYITGESGSGKSVILRELFPEYEAETIPADTPLYLWGGESDDEQHRTMESLSLVGLSDALNFVSTYDELSDSQQARARLYLEIASEKPVIVVDEFLSTLDRRTAQAVSFVVQKAVRKSGKVLFAATAHDDLIDYLQPDLVVRGRAFPSSFDVVPNEPSGKNPFIDKVIVRYGTKEEYRSDRLGELHYKGKYTGGVKEFLFAEIDGRIIGVLVSIYNMHTGGRRIARLVVHPTYRCCGIGQMLVRRYLSDFENVDVVAAMGLVNPVFEKAGMARVEDSVSKAPNGLADSIMSLGFDLSKWHNCPYCVSFCQQREARAVVSRFAKKATHLVQPGGVHIGEDSIRKKILDDSNTAGRVLYQLRPHRMAKYVWSAEEGAE